MRNLSAWLIFSFSICLSTNSFSQSHPDTTYARALDLFVAGEYLQAAALFEKANEEELLEGMPRQVFMVDNLYNAGVSYYNAYIDSLALLRLTAALDIYLELDEKAMINKTLYFLASAHLNVQNYNIPIDLVPNMAMETKSWYFNISTLDQDFGDSLKVTIYGGKNDGLYKGSRGPLHSYGRSETDFGSVVVNEAGLNYAKATIYLTKPVDRPVEFRLDDLAYLPARIPQKSYGSIFQDLSGMAIFFNGNENEVLYHSRILIYNDNPKLDYYLLSLIKDQIQETVAENYSPEVELWHTIPTTGSYEGMTLKQIMEETTESDVLAYLRFVKSYPRQYMGQFFKVNETYATWIINNSQYGSDQLLEELVPLWGERLEKLVKEHEELIVDDEFFTDWLYDAEDLGDYGMIDSALKIIEPLYQVANILGRKDLEADVAFSEGNIYLDLPNYDKAIQSYQIAADIEKDIGDFDGQSSNIHNIAISYRNKLDYKKAIEFFNLAVKIRVDNFPNDSSYTYNFSLANAHWALGGCYYNLGQYKEALSAYQLAINYFELAPSLSSTSRKASIFSSMADAYEKLAEYEKAISIQHESIAMYEALGDRISVAEGHDDVAYIMSRNGRSADAFNFYQKAYEIKLANKDTVGAAFSRSNCGQTAWQQGKYEEAILSHEEAIFLAGKSGDQNREAYSLRQLASLYSESGDPIKALDFYGRSLQIYEAMGNKEQLGGIYRDLGAYYSKIDDYSNATDYYFRALENYKAVNQNYYIAETMTDLGNIYYDKKEYGTARKYYENSLTLQDSMGDRAGMIYNMVNLGLIASYFDIDYERSERLVQEALKIARATDNQWYVGYCRNNLGGLQLKNGQYKEAEENFTQALEINKKLNDKIEIMNNLNQLAFLKGSVGEFDQSLAYYRQIQEMAEASSNNTYRLTAKMGIAEIYRLQGEFQKALEINLEALAKNEAEKNDWGIASAQINLGNIYNTIGNYNKAITSYAIADSLYSFLQLDFFRATPLNNTGTIYYWQGDFKRALPYFIESEKILDVPSTDIAFHALVKANIGEVLLEMKDFEAADKWLLESLKLAKSIENNHSIAHASKVMAKLRMRQGKHEEAEKLFLNAVELFNKTGERPAEAEINGWLGQLYYRMERFEEASVYLTKSINVARKTGTTKILWEPLYYQSMIKYQTGETDTSIAYLKAAIETLESLSNSLTGGQEAQKIFVTGEEKVLLYEQYVYFLMEQGRIEEANSFLNYANIQNYKSKFNLLYDKVGEEWEKLQQKQMAAEQAEKNYKKEISKPEHLQNQQLIAKLEEVRQVKQNEYFNYMDELRKSGLLDSFSRETTTPEEIYGILNDEDVPADIAVVQYMISKNKLYIFVSLKESVFAKEIEVNEKELERNILDFYRLNHSPGFSLDKIKRAKLASAPEISTAREDDFLDIAEYLYNVLIDPIKNDLAGRKKLVIIPNKSLYYLPFQSIGHMDAENKFMFLFEEFALVYNNDIYDLLGQRRDPAKINLLAFGNADNTLPFAEEEVLKLKEIYPTALIYVQTEATADKITSDMGKYNAVHFATHGVLDYSEFSNSYLVMADTFSISDIRSMRALDNLDLITLSACETAVTYEMVQGWPVNTASVFIKKRVKSVVASQWQVDDKATSIFMQQFYKNLNTMDKATALQQAQAYMVNETEFQHPYYWAPFILIGSWK